MTQDKKKTIKTIALVVISVIFLAMFYITFFKGKKTSGKRVAKKQTQQAFVATPETPAAPAPLLNEDTKVETDNTAFADIPVDTPFKPMIKNIFIPTDAVKKVLEKKPEKTEIQVVKAVEKLPPLSEQEKSSIQQALAFKGSMLSNTIAVAIINDAFFHVGDIVNGFKVTSISEKQVILDTGRGVIILEIMKHE